MSLFSRSVVQIEDAYVSLGHTCGWRFPYSPEKTLSGDAPILFAGLNPGGSQFHPPMPSVEEGNAYRVETWGDNGSPNKLQRQVVSLFEILAHKLDQPDAASLMDATLTANFCPFRSPSWSKLPNRRKSVAFSRGLWSQILTQVAPSVFLCLADLPYRYFRKVLLSLGGLERGFLQERVDWGDITYTQSHLAFRGREILILRLPHLSRFGLIGRQESMPSVERFTDAVAKHVRANA